MIQFLVALFFAIPGLGSYLPVQAAQISTPEKTDLLLNTAALIEEKTSSNILFVVSSPTKETVPIIKKEIKKENTSVPFYSQFTDITDPTWKKVGCGVTSLAMIIDYYKPDTVSVDTLLKQGIKEGAYLQNAGWTYKGLISLSNKYDLDGESYDLASLSDTEAFSKFKEALKDGPVMASVHYNFDPKSTIPHLVVINNLDENTLTYNDPAAKTGEKTISSENFIKAWKKRFLVFRPE